ncbi:GNAT family N-acetyltransferase [Paenibacillus qinlingensis]|uniref:GNAT superfamily N-acetyltransferase n=1 Tax=Paenibacillus qinlingensis TaxID=1837343 RepID=A0ABU1NMW9_9BACL|nr:GNAT family N-acetyltransferase [Paenibacillus qinlingensis]MDR6548819.1 GNAT superfamily N-acetyltransferase [Paenibacillus qinlingensis]
MDISIVVLKELDEGVHYLADMSASEGHRHIQTLVREYQSGQNQFRASGEILLSAMVDGKMVGVCGLNRMTLENNEDIGRVRRLYVLETYRRYRVGKTLMTAIIHEAQRHYQALVLYTNNPVADAFYRNLGFISCTTMGKSTHYLDLRENRVGGDG